MLNENISQFKIMMIYGCLQRLRNKFNFSNLLLEKTLFDAGQELACVMNEMTHILTTTLAKRIIIHSTHPSYLEINDTDIPKIEST